MLAKPRLRPPASWLALALALVACGTPPPEGSPQAREGRRPERRRPAPPPSAVERYCAWYGDARDGVLYFGESAFWAASSGGAFPRGTQPTADLDAVGPTLIGRFDLRGERMLPPFVVGGSADRAGVWDVLVHPNGRIYFTTFFEAAGYFDTAEQLGRRLPKLGAGLNELALGPEGSVLISRYAPSEPGASGSVLVIDADGRRLAEHALAPPPGLRVAPKSVAWDPVREQIWVTTDLHGSSGGRGHHDAYVLDAEGREVRRIEQPELQFVAFGPDGTGWFAERAGNQLWLRILPPAAAGYDEGRRVLLDGAFPARFDFAQDIKPSPGGAAVVTRWSGWVHVVERDGSERRTRFRSRDADGLYYTALVEGSRVCATYCADVSVVCRDAP